MSDDDKRLKQIVKELKCIKEQQDKVVSESYNLLELQINQYVRPETKFIYGFIDKIEYSGLIANKISSKYQKPTIIFNDVENENRELKGSIRGYGVENFKDDINNTGLAICAGHPNAAGITAKVTDINKLILALNKIYKDKNFVVTYNVDIKLEYNQINDYVINEILKINRSAGENFKPVTVCLTDVEVMNPETMKDKHTKFNYYDIVFLKWNDTKLYNEILCDDGCYTSLNVICEIQINKFAGRKEIQFIINDYDNINKLPEFLKDNGN
jgi:single-stranded DNA-specific DHH superfamily exonuclease